MISYSVSLSLIMVSVIFLAGSVDLVHVMCCSGAVNSTSCWHLVDVVWL